MLSIRRYSLCIFSGYATFTAFCTGLFNGAWMHLHCRSYTDVETFWPFVQAFWVLSLVYYVIHYLFASQTAHVAALYSPFLQTMLAAGTPSLCCQTP